MLNLSGKCSRECQSSNSMRCAGAMSHHMSNCRTAQKGHESLHTETVGLQLAFNAVKERYWHRSRLNAPHYRVLT